MPRITPDFTFHIASLRFADKFMATGEWTSLVSIGHPNGTENCVLRAPHSLVLNMWDDAPYWRRVRGLPRGEDVLRLITFAREIHPGERLLLHCKAGRSRSTASAMIVMAARGLSEEYCLAALLRNGRKATPNGWLLKLADALLDTSLFAAAKEAGIVKWKREVASA